MAEIANQNSNAGPIWFGVGLLNTLASGAYYYRPEGLDQNLSYATAVDRAQSYGLITYTTMWGSVLFLGTLAVFFDRFNKTYAVVGNIYAFIGYLIIPFFLMYWLFAAVRADAND